MFETRRRLARCLVVAACGLLTLATGPAQAQLVAAYATAPEPLYQHYVHPLREQQALEVLAQTINNKVRWPRPVALTLAPCGQVNALYDPVHFKVLNCSELLADLDRRATQELRQLPANLASDVVLGALLFVVYHEVGHALVHTLKLPVLGREEDAADAISTYFLLNLAKPGVGVMGATWFNRSFADEHSLGEQRKFNIVCLALGSNPTGFAPLAEKAQLPPERAARCPAEFRQLQTSVHQLLGAYLR